MKLAIRAYFVTLILLMLVFAVPAQKLSEKDDRNTAPIVGTGGQVSGPTGLFTVLDGKTLRKGEYTLSAALSNYDRDPGNADFTSVPLSFQIGLTNKLELFFSTEAWRGIKVNSPRNLSGFYLPNSQILINGGLTSAPAIVLAPQGPGASAFTNTAVFRPQGAPFVAFPYSGGNAGTYGFIFPFTSGPAFGFAAGTNAQLGSPSGGGRAAFFPGVGSAFGSILPGLVLQTAPINCQSGIACGNQPTSFTVAPSYLPDAPFLNRIYGTSAFNSFTGGVKWRFTDISNPIGLGLMASYRWYTDRASSSAGFNQMQRGAGPGANRGDIAVTAFFDDRLTTWANLSANIGYTYTTNPKGTFTNGSFTLLDRPDELLSSVGVDFPINKFFQPILEFSYLRYLAHRTPNAFENNPMDGIAGIRIYPRRWWGVGLAYRYNFNQQDDGSFDGSSNNNSVRLLCGPVSAAGCTPSTVTQTSTGVPRGFVTSSDPSGYIAQFWIGRRDKRAGPIENKPASVDSVDLSSTVITLPCRAGTKSRSGACNDNKTISITTHASDPENDVLTYNYTVSGGRIVGTGANAQWDLTGAQVGSYTVTVGVDDGCGVCGKTVSKTITVQECPDCVAILNCSCSTPTVSGPSGVTNPGDAMTFTASVSGDVTYTWTVSAGTIESGQGTPSISVRTTEAMAGSNVTATVDIGGTNPDCHCITNAAETAGIQAKPTFNTVDEFGKAENDDVKARVDNFYIQLDNNPNAQGYIINYGSPADIKKRKAQIEKAIAFRKKDRSRLVWVDGPDNGTGVSTKFIVVPAGAIKPTP